jgi:1,4-alpha-glucan branching enzyme
MRKTIKKALESKSKTSSLTPGKESGKTLSKVSKSKATGILTSLKKQYMKKSRACKVTFRLPKKAAPNARMVTIVGDFNNWNLTETKMQKLINGDFKVTLELPCDKEYRFRYLIDTNKWENDWFADKYIPNPFGDEDSVVVI